MTRADDLDARDFLDLLQYELLGSFHRLHIMLFDRRDRHPEQDVLRARLSELWRTMHAMADQIKELGEVLGLEESVAAPPRSDPVSAPVKPEVMPANGPYHDFWLVSKDEFASYSILDLLSYVGQRGKPVTMSFNLFAYLNDTLNWIQRSEPGSEGRNAAGLDWFNVNPLSGAAAQTFHSLCTAWAQLFAVAPETFVLNGGWTFFSGEGDSADQNGWYQPVEYKRETVLDILNRLADWSAQASTGEYILIHSGP